LPLLATLGLWSLALGALSGWLVAAAIDKPEVLRRLRIRHAARVRQTHLDWILMGLLLLAVHLAVPSRPDWITGLIAFGTVVNPLLFVPLAFSAGLQGHPAYRAVTLVSFLSLSVGLPALAVHATL
jgi:hypothetical protein